MMDCFRIIEITAKPLTTALARLPKANEPQVALDIANTGEMTLYVQPVQNVASVELMLAVLNSGGEQLYADSMLPTYLEWLDLGTMHSVLAALDAYEDAILANA